MDHLSEWLAFLLTLALATSPPTLQSPTRSTSPYISLGVTSIQFDPVSGELVPQIITRLKQDLQLKPSSYGYVTLGFYLIESAKLAEATLAFRQALALPMNVEHSDNIHAIAYEGLGLSFML
jgi:cytochrome c-type biogenesis protein CcmH/NrfG